jgi:hypothetical protein
MATARRLTVRRDTTRTMATGDNDNDGDGAMGDEVDDDGDDKDYGGGRQRR